MGYNTDWNGCLKLSRPLKQQELKEWNEIVENRHDSEYNYGDSQREFPSIWCGFDIEGLEFRWDGNEKTYEGVGWIKFFVKKLEEWSKENDHLIYAEGEMFWSGEECDDVGKVSVEFLPFGEGHKVNVTEGNIIYEGNLWVLDHERGDAYNYNCSLQESDEIEEWLTEQHQHNLTNCNWLLKN